MPLNILCIDDDRNFLIHLQLQLEDLHKVVTAADVRTGLIELKLKEIDVILLDIGLKGIDGLEGLKILKKEYPQIPVIMVTAMKDTKTVVKSIRDGAANYICKPFETEELTALLSEIEETKNLREHNQALIATLNNNYIDIPMVGKNSQFRQLIEQASMVKGHGANILIQGENGTGKELLALYIRNLENDSNRPFIAINCAAIPENLMESELFGHEKGAFTSAIRRKIGKLELAGGGDLFLDEISSLPLDLQSKLLRSLQEKAFCRVGGNQPINSDFRVIAATNVDLEEMIEQKRFRMDLFHRLRVVHLRIPPLRERTDDIPELVDIFLAKHAAGEKCKTISDEAVRLLMKYSWPGNIRELENLIHSLVIMCPSDEIGIDHLPAWLTDSKNGTTGRSFLDQLGDEQIADATLKDYVRAAERRYVAYVLEKNGGNRQEAAKDLGIARSTFYIKLRELGL